MSLTPLPYIGHSLTVLPHIIPLCNMEPHKLISKTPSSQPQSNTTYQNTNATNQNSNATQPNANQSSCIQFGIGESGTAPCGITSVGVRIACSQGGTAIYFSGEVVGGSKVAASDLEAFRQALQEKVNASVVLANSAIQVSATLVPKHGMPNQNGKVTRESAAKVAAALGADHRRAAGGSPRLHRMAEFMTMWGDPARDVTLPGTGKRTQTAKVHRLLPEAYTGWRLEELADPNFVPSEVGLPVMWTNPNGDQLPLTGRPHPSTTQTAKSDRGPTTNSWWPNGESPSQGSDHTGATAGPGVFAGAGTQSLIPVVSPMGYSNLGRTLGPDVNAFEPQPKAFDHFSDGTLTYMKHLNPNQRYQSLTGNLLTPTSVSEGNTFVPPFDPDSTHKANLPRQSRLPGPKFSNDPWNQIVPGAAPVSNIQDHRRSTQHFSSVNTGTPVRLVDPPAFRPWPDYVREFGASVVHSDQNPPTSSGHGSTLPSSSKSSKPTASKQSTGKRPVRPPVTLADSQSISHPYTGSSTHLAPSSRAVSGRRSSPHWVPRPEDKGKRRE
jgi:hypothetical protein